MLKPPYRRHSDRDRNVETVCLRGTGSPLASLPRERPGWARPATVLGRGGDPFPAGANSIRERGQLPDAVLRPAASQPGVGGKRRKRRKRPHSDWGGLVAGWEDRRVLRDQPE